ncbi:Uncharacterised protein [Streptococcus pneumoniae]|nr:Uncharacterised protein [Streptococcus pneumoniae]
MRGAGLDGVGAGGGVLDDGTGVDGGGVHGVAAAQERLGDQEGHGGQGQRDQAGDPDRLERPEAHGVEAAEERAEGDDEGDQGTPDAAHVGVVDGLAVADHVMLLRCGPGRGGRPAEVMRVSRIPG